jgi:hypothetical protein
MIKKKDFFFAFVIHFLLVRDHASMYEQRKNSSKIIANLTTHCPDEQQIPSPPPSAHKLQKQLSVQDTIQRHFCQILKNDSLTVTDNTSITETILMRENSSSVATTLSMLENNLRVNLVTSEFKINIDKIRADGYIFSKDTY